MEKTTKENIILKIWRVIYPILIYLGISVVISFIGMVVIGIIMSTNMAVTGEELDVVALTKSMTDVVMKYSMLFTLIAALITLPILLHIFKKDKKKGLVLESTRTDTKIPAYQYSYIVLIGITACIGFNYLIIISRLSEFFPSYMEKFAKLIYSGNTIVMILGAVFIVPIVEELLFRGLVYNRLCGYMKKIPAMLISTVLFGIYHMNVVQGIYAFAIGVCLVFVYEKYKTIWAPILFHGTANGISVVISTTGMDSQLQDNTLISLAITVVACGLTALLLLMMHKKVQPIEKVSCE